MDSSKVYLSNVPAFPYLSIFSYLKICTIAMYCIATVYKYLMDKKINYKNLWIMHNKTSAFILWYYVCILRVHSIRVYYICTIKLLSQKTIVDCCITIIIIYENKSHIQYRDQSNRTHTKNNPRKDQIYFKNFLRPSFMIAYVVHQNIGKSISYHFHEKL